ncbi:hypothetical protein AYM40_36935 (plasmid) [Paraburkholderia phytofirmans OLGA172]|uniref:Uncharacterized protein n=1 Tax=Paraburkholderia phytofirmans OLGA172 TaxID=1417228 RepID=A0A160FXN8_9BURK|nr:hypothetical protein AYM40_36935 [Paraburkholderia phytofirmans OLGA172]
MCGGFQQSCDADCYRVARERGSCLASARFTGSPSNVLAAGPQIAVVDAFKRRRGVRAVTDRMREPFGAGVTQPVRGRSSKPVGIVEPAMGAGVGERLAAQPGDRFPDRRAATDALEFAAAGASHRQRNGRSSSGSGSAARPNAIRQACNDSAISSHGIQPNGRCRA